MSSLPPACLVHTSLSPLLVYTLKQCPLMPLEYGRFLEENHQMATDFIQKYIDPITVLFKNYHKKAFREEGDTVYKTAITASLEMLSDIKNNHLSPLHMNVWELGRNFHFALNTGKDLETVLTFTAAHFSVTKPLIEDLNALKQAAIKLSNLVAKNVADIKQEIKQSQSNSTATS